MCPAGQLDILAQVGLCGMRVPGGDPVPTGNAALRPWFVDRELLAQRDVLEGKLRALLDRGTERAAQGLREGRAAG